MKHKQFRIILFLIFSILPLLCLQAQEPVEVKVSNHKVILEGKVYFIHVVKPGQTLTSISKAYNVRQKDIALENPGVYSGLQIGQLLKIPADVPVFPEETNVQDIDTVRFFPHYLKEGETIYSLSRQYNLPVGEIEKANPSLDYNDLPIGRLVLIPKHSITREDVEFILHRVRRKETLFGLAKKYEMKESVIEKYNPEIVIEGLKAGQMIRIPQFDTRPEQQDEFITEENSTVESDSLYEIVYDPVGMNEYHRKITDIDPYNLKVAFLIPFDYYEEEIVDSLEMLDETGEEDKEKSLNLPKSPNFLEFFEGSLLAVNKLKDEGVNVELSFFDTRKSPSRTREILSSEEFSETDLIIGPFYSWNVEIASEYSREYGVPLISPFYENCELTAENPFLFQLNPSYKVEYRTMAKILSDEYEKNFVFVYSSDSSKMEEIEYLKSNLEKGVSEYIPKENFVIKEIVYNNAAKADLSNDLKLAFSEDKPNIVVIPETNEAFVSSVIQKLYFLFELEEYNVEVFGMPHFAEFKSIEYRYFYDLKLRYVTPYYWTYQDSIIDNFLSEYRAYFKSEPSRSTRKGYPYAIAGYDISYFFINGLANNGRRFITELNVQDAHTNLIPFVWRKESEYGGFENHHLSLVEFVEGYDFHVEDVSQMAFKLQGVKKKPWYFNFDY